MAPSLRRKCLAALCKICGHHALISRSIQIPLCYNRGEAPRYEGGFAEVWKGEREGTEVAVKVLKIFMTSDLAKIRKVGFSVSPKCVGRPVNVDHAEVLQGSDHLEGSSPSECAATVGSDNGQQPIRDGVGMDGQWKHQRVRQEEQGRKPFQTRTILFLLYTVPATDGIVSNSSKTSLGG